MKTRKVVNIRKSLIAGALSVTTLLAGLGILKGCSPDEANSNANTEPSSSHTIIDDSQSHDQELPGGVIIDPSGKETDVTNSKDATTPSDSAGSGEHQTDTEIPSSQTGSETDEKENDLGGIKPGAETIDTSISDTNTDTSLTDTSTEDPSINVNDEETPEHIHVLGEWVSINDYFEGNYCPDDGVLLSVRAHDFEVTDTVFTSNYDWTHNISTTGTCVNCGHTKTITQNDIECTDVTLTWDNIFEYQTCNDCGYMRNVGKHLFDKGTIDNGYVTYRCTHEGCDYEYSRQLDDGRDDNTHTNPGTTNPGTNPGTHIHYNGEWVSYNDDKEVNYCPEDGYIMGYRDHSYGEGSTTITSVGSDTHSIASSHSCSTCGHEKTNSSTVSCDFALTGSVTDENGIITDTYTCANCGNTYSKTRPSGSVDPVDPIKIDVESLISIDPSSLEFIYDGEAHSPIITGIPDNVTPRFVSVQGENAGEYVWRIEFDTPEGYYADPIEINYTIIPATVGFSYECIDGVVEAKYTGIAPGDIASTKYTVNGEEVSSGVTNINDYGFYKLESNIEISEDKLDNYVFTADLHQSSIYEVKRENTWFDVELECTEVDGKLVVDVIWSGGDKLPFDAFYDEDAEEFIGICMPSIGFNIYFDSSQLSLDESGLNNEAGWDGYINPEFKHSQEELVRDFITSPSIDNWDYDNGLPQSVKLCSLTFDYVPGHENDKDIVIKLDDFEASTGGDNYDFVYTTNASTCIVNPSKETDNVTTIIRDNDLQDDARYNPNLAIEEPDEDELEEERQARETLQEFIDNGFTFSDGTELEEGPVEETPKNDQESFDEGKDEEDMEETDALEVPGSEQDDSSDSSDDYEEVQDFAEVYQEYLNSVSTPDPMSFTYEGEEYTLYFDSPVESIENNEDDLARVLQP